MGSGNISGAMYFIWLDRMSFRREAACFQAKSTPPAWAAQDRVSCWTVLWSLFLLFTGPEKAFRAFRGHILTLHPFPHTFWCFCVFLVPLLVKGRRPNMKCNQGVNTDWCMDGRIWGAAPKYGPKHPYKYPSLTIYTFKLMQKLVDMFAGTSIVGIHVATSQSWNCAVM